MLSNLLSVFVIPIILNGVHNNENVKKMFNYYKDKYNWLFKSEEELQRAMKNFALNVDKINDLNKHDSDVGTLYIVNKYSDLDADDIREHYAVTIKPYTNARNHEEQDALRNKKQNDFDVTTFYDLDNAEELYKDYLEKFNKKNYTSRHDRLIHYYRFVKTLADINKSRFEGVKVELDENADILKEPKEYFLG